jgi:hypothetical protein
MVRRFSTLLIVFVLSVPVLCYSQAPTGTSKQPSNRLFPQRDRTFEIMGGMEFPMSHSGLTGFWMRGPSVAASLYFKASDKVRFGVGIETAVFSFRRGTFAQTYPGVVVQARDLASTYLYIAARDYLQPRWRVTPFFGGEIGVLRCSGAEYKAIVNGVRQTYYEIPGMAHLAASGSAGLDFYLARFVALQVEGRIMYVVNDPDAGILTAVHAGLKFAL